MASQMALADNTSERPPADARQVRKLGKQAPTSGSALPSPPYTSIEIEHRILG